ncbi:transporter substrate-binding domain-containing protein [Simiduia sp. 21SJ11W-1]|uniref:substrate-binding periplasmic protein n=1 Tax=Simiduia sp. 21SJ11W-1 TaxID=2909669 RepID=UPI0020A1D593|nr:transporter substrate-binding domain-containing protein [Simiduia sp. 21SJ11W-1]UTA46721.1 transporter substrate-binding domain-containing protein [Simiduia sp. 21SJ11W-1]
MRTLLLLITLLPTLALAARPTANPNPYATPLAPLVLVYGGHVVEPYVFLQEGQVVGGVYYDLGQLISSELKRPVSYLRVPRRRMELFLAQGKGHVMPLAHPSWVANPSALHWTSPLITEYDLLVQRRQATFAVHSLDDLVGKRIGTILGYYYPGLSDAPYNETILRDDAKDIEANFKRLAQGRIDALLGSNILIEYFLQKQGVANRFHLVTSWGIEYQVVSAVSPKSPVSAAQLSQAYQALHARGAIGEVINRYAPHRVNLKPAATHSEQNP